MSDGALTTNAAVSANFRRAFLKVLRTPSHQLASLELHWPRLEKQIKERRKKLAANIPHDDPIRLPVDLLTPLGRIADETLHTRAIAYLLNNNNGHGLGKQVLSSLLEKIRDIRYGTGASKILALLHRQRTKISVTPEYRYCIEGFRNRSVARCDIWITIEARKHKALLVIENKVGAIEGKGQLGWYQRKARSWCKSHGGRALLVYLAAERISKDKWVSISYLDLASALRKVWRKNSHAAGQAWLGLYIAAVTNGLLEADVERRPQDVELDDLMDYLGKAH